MARSDAYPFSVAQCLPAPGQGALGIEIVTDSPVQALLETLIDKDVARCVEAERGISAGLGADCALGALGSKVLYTRWPNPIIFSFLANLSFVNATASASLPCSSNSISICITAVFAPP